MTKKLYRVYILKPDNEINFDVDPFFGHMDWEEKLIFPSYTDEEAVDHNFSDAPIELTTTKYKCILNVGQKSIKLTSDSLELVRVNASKLVLNEYFRVDSNFLGQDGEFRANIGENEAFKGKLVSADESTNSSIRAHSDEQEPEKNKLNSTGAKQWFHMDRSTLFFLKKLREEEIIFKQQHDFDENGLIYFIGSNGKTTEWVNPGQYGLVNVSKTKRKLSPHGKLEDILSRDCVSVNCYTKSNKNPWFAIDLGVFIIPTAYTLRHARGYGRSALRWLLQASKDAVNWITLGTHNDDRSLTEPGSSCTWAIFCPPEETEGFRHIRIQQNGRNASNQTHYLSLSGFEIYGRVVSVCEDMGKRAVREQEAKLYREQIEHMTTGTRVVRGVDWRWDNQDGTGDDRIGTVTGEIHNGWIDVKRDHGVKNSYLNLNAEGKYDLKLVNCDDLPLCTIADQAPSADNLTWKQAVETIAENLLTSAKSDIVSSEVEEKPNNQPNVHVVRELKHHHDLSLINHAHNAATSSNLATITENYTLGSEDLRCNVPSSSAFVHASSHSDDKLTNIEANNKMNTSNSVNSISKTLLGSLRGCTAIVALDAIDKMSGIQNSTNNVISSEILQIPPNSHWGAAAHMKLTDENNPANRYTDDVVGNPMSISVPSSVSSTENTSQMVPVTPLGLSETVAAKASGGDFQTNNQPIRYLNQTNASNVNAVQNNGSMLPRRKRKQNLWVMIDHDEKTLTGECSNVEMCESTEAIQLLNHNLIIQSKKQRKE